MKPPQPTDLFLPTYLFFPFFQVPASKPARINLRTGAPFDHLNTFHAVRQPQLTYISSLMVEIFFNQLKYLIIKSVGLMSACMKKAIPTFLHKKHRVKFVKTKIRSVLNPASCRLNTSAASPFLVVCIDNTTKEETWKQKI